MEDGVDPSGSRRGRILIVDDDPESRSALRMLFEDDGYEVVVAADGQQALAAVAARRPDVVVSDVQMPVLDGPTFLVRLHAQEPGLPVVLMSGLPAERVKEVSRAHAFVPKPIDLDELERAVERAFGNAA